MQIFLKKTVGEPDFIAVDIAVDVRPLLNQHCNVSIAYGSGFYTFYDNQSHNFSILKEFTYMYKNRVVKYSQMLAYPLTASFSILNSL